MPIYSTAGPADGSGTARVILDAVRKCPHERNPLGDAFDLQSAVHRVAGTLAQVAALLEAAEQLAVETQAQKSADAAVEDALLRLETGTNNVSDLEQDLVRAERRADGAAERARTAALRAQAADPWPPADGARTLLDQAERGLDDAAGLTTLLGPDHPDCASLAAELQRLRGCAQRLSTQVQK